MNVKSLAANKSVEGAFKRIEFMHAIIPYHDSRFTFFPPPLAVAMLAVFTVIASGCAYKHYPATAHYNLNTCVYDPVCTRPLAIGHRGTGCVTWVIPENTLIAFKTAWLMGADGIELDVRDTKDGVPVIMHDSTVDRTTNGTGRVDRMTLAEIKKLKIYSLGLVSPVQTVPTLREVLALMRGKTMLDLDIKHANIYRLTKIIAEESMLDSAYLLIDNLKEGLAARRASAHAALMPKVHNLVEVKQYLRVLSPIAIFEIGYFDASSEMVDYIHSRGIKVHIDAIGYFDFIDPFGYQTLMDHGADIILTDRLNALVPFLLHLGPTQN